MRRLILNIHLFIALIAGAFIVLLGATGGVLAFEPELDRLRHPHLSYVAPGGKVLSLREIGDAVSRKSGGEPIVAYMPAVSPELSSQVVLPSGIVCVNQYTGEVLGARTRGQTFLGLARALHVRLAGGSAGREIMKWSGVAILFSLASGLYLWWPGKRVRIRGCWRSRGFWFDLHNAIGILSFLPLVVLALTATVIGFEDQAKPLLEKLTSPAPVRTSQTVTKREPSTGATPITPDEAVAIVRTQMPDLIPYRVQMPRYGGVYRVSLLNPHDKIAGGHNLFGVDPYSGNVLFSVRSSDLPFTEKILAVNQIIHTGDILGLPSRIIVWLTSVILPVQVLSGLLMWWRRRRVPASGTST